MNAARAVTMIPPTMRLHSTTQFSDTSKRRVAAYARVSTDNEEQLTSYEAQVEHYTRTIQENSDWEFVSIYTDEGISGTDIRKRKGFQRMIADALAGKLDLILTKSISRFARNTVDSLITVRQLKEKGVEVWFEKDGLKTFDPSAELTITILSSIAQEESRNLSENVKWGHRTRYADGKVTMPFKRFLGYDRGEDGQPVVNEEQAGIVRAIYRMYVNGHTPSAIAKQLTAEGVSTPGGRQVWQATVVESILTNEKYKGDALLQKTFCTDYLTKKMKVNEGEIPQYYVENSHPAIVSAELYDHVQAEMKRRKGVRYVASAGCFAGRVICGECGSVYGAKVWHSTSKYRRTIWQCNGKFKGEKKCGTPHFYEAQIKAAFLQVMNRLIADLDGVEEAYRAIAKTLLDNTALEAEAETLQGECDVVLGLMRKMVSDNAHAPLDQEDYQRRYEILVSRYDIARNRLAEVSRMLEELEEKGKEIKRFMALLKKRDGLLTDFDEELWCATVHQVVVRSATEMVFLFKDGTEAPWTKS